MEMTASFDHAYFEARLKRNRQLADETTDPMIRELHLKYVLLYEQLMEVQQPACS